MKIKAINPQQKNKQRYNIFDEEGFAGALNLEAVVKNKLREDTEITKEDFDKILLQDNERYAFDKALNFLSFCARTEQDIARFLKNKQLGEPVIQNTIEKLKNYGYIDDAAYARQLAQSLLQSKKLGRQAAAYRLRQKGIPQDMVEEVLEEYPEETEAQNAREIYETLLSKYKNDDTNKRRMKITRNMAAKGYDYDLIHALVYEREE